MQGKLFAPNVCFIYFFIGVTTPTTQVPNQLPITTRASQNTALPQNQLSVLEILSTIQPNLTPKMVYSFIPITTNTQSKPQPQSQVTSQQLTTLTTEINNSSTQLHPTSITQPKPFRSSPGTTSKTKAEYL